MKSFQFLLRGPELIACLARVENYLAAHPEFQAGYRECGPVLPVVLPEFHLQTTLSSSPVSKALGAQRLLLRGTGEWPLDEYVEESFGYPMLSLPSCFMEVKLTLRHGLPS